MEKTIFFFIFLNITLTFGQNQTNYYPTGIYNSYEDFVKREPNSGNVISVKENRNIINNTFRIKNSEGKKVKNAFAVSDGKKIYVRTNAMKEYFTNPKFDKPNTTNKDFSAVIIKNDKYLYFESYFQSKGVSNWGVGKIYLSGIIYNISEGTFTALNSIEDLNKFLEKEKIEKVDLKILKSDKLEIGLTRKMMFEILESD